MSGFLEAVRDNLEYLQDYQEVQATKKQMSDSLTNQVLKDIQDVMPEEEKPDYTNIIMISGAVLIVGLLLFSGAKK